MNCLLFWLLYAVRIILVSQKTKTIEKGTCKSKCLFLVRMTGLEPTQYCYH